MHSPAGYYTQIKRFLLNELWRTDVESLGWLQRYAYKLIRLLFVLVREFANGQLNLRAMSLVYTTLLSMVPLLAVSFSVLKAFGVHNQIEPLLLGLVEPLGEKGDEIVFNILGFVENMKVGVLGSVGLALLLYTVISLIQKVEVSFNYVWHTKSSRSLSRRFSDYLSVIMVGPVLVFSAIGLTASMMRSEVVQTIVSIEPFGSLVVFVSKLVPFFLVILAFSFVYVFVPNTKVKFSSALVGAVVGGALWQTSGLVFAEFASSSTKYAAIYSGFAILIMFMIWLYLSWLVLLLGAQVAYYHQYPEQIRLSSQRVPLSGRFREQMGLLIMYWITNRFVHEGKPLSLESLTQKLYMPGDRVGETLQLLQERGLLLESGSEPPTYLLAHDPANLTVAELMEIMRQPDDEQVVMENRLISVPQVDALMQEVERGIREHLDGMTLRELALQPLPDAGEKAGG
ncbi:MAG: YihY/virulence factor BrkB family protein [Gammaproteobacteria bacterium]|nr:YihY/virulence factor BrkB family protein [Gammaproteobacteria bacterium]MCW8973018.1 YihY/virulence factor BrkB family protein [Gammaproteobacteria bacterium]MCW8992938.1 YihY/virulence factor BrkB family protein [Gammaproteobacteria bacterium]MCW9088530.1 YihY/virulence factor BrkB family protein [Gammaproteobacteria bacterium]